MSSFSVSARDDVLDLSVEKAMANYTTFKCGAGNAIAGVALIGDVVTLK